MDSDLFYNLLCPLILKYITLLISQMRFSILFLILVMMYWNLSIIVEYCSTDILQFYVLSVSITPLITFYIVINVALTIFSTFRVVKKKEVKSVYSIRHLAESVRLVRSTARHRKCCTSTYQAATSRISQIWSSTRIFSSFWIQTEALAKAFT